jgi:hypothetical protein
MLSSLGEIAVVFPSFPTAWCESPFTYANLEALILAPFEF